jgi:hypothetical protein
VWRGLDACLAPSSASSPGSDDGIPRLRTDALHQNFLQKSQRRSLQHATTRAPGDMLTEHFVAAIAAATKPNTGVTKDAGIFVHEHQPLAAQRHVFKKSASAPHGIAVSSSHVFAAQADKAVVHVYSRDKGNQEAVVPFPERIHSIALAAGDAVLLLGTESGRVLAWEVSSPGARSRRMYRALTRSRYAPAASSPRPRRICSP